jgi:hypothetical protein
MARTIKSSPKATESPIGRGEHNRSIFQQVLCRISCFFNTQSDRDIERFISKRGEVMSDALVRELDRHFGRM